MKSSTQSSEMFVAVSLVCISSLVVYVQGSLKCLCATVQLQVAFNKGPSLLPKDECADIVDNVKGANGSVWYMVKYNNQSGWIQANNSMMSVIPCRFINVFTTTAAPCSDAGRYDCHWLNSTNNFCSDKAAAQQYCAKYCKICNSGDTITFGR